MDVVLCPKALVGLLGRDDRNRGIHEQVVEPEIGDLGAPGWTTSTGGECLAVEHHRPEIPSAQSFFTEHL